MHNLIPYTSTHQRINASCDTKPKCTENKKIECYYKTYYYLLGNSLVHHLVGFKKSCSHWTPPIS